jgi:hypothetical protein
MIRCGAATRGCCYFPANGSSKTRVCVAYRKGELAINTIVLGTESAQGASARAKEGEEGTRRGREGKGRKRTRVVSPPLPLTNGPGRNPPSNDAQSEPPQKLANDVEKSETASGALTDMLIPDPLFPALAIRRRYLLLCQACDVERAQTIKRDRHSEKKKVSQIYICTPALVRRDAGSKERYIYMRTSKRPSRRGSLAAQPDISHNARRGLPC